jgi:hypothetical protein
VSAPLQLRRSLTWLITAAAAAAALLFAAPSAQAAFGFLPGPAGFEVSASQADGAVADQAGSHPYSLTTKMNFNLEAGGTYSDGDVRDLRIEQPPGLVENPTVVEQCPPALFRTPRDSPFQESASGESCPLRTQVGTLTVRGPFPGGARTFGLFNLVPPPGFLSLIGASPFGTPITFSSRVRSSEGEFGISLEAHNVSQQLDLSGLTMTRWGNPWLVGHDSQRGDCLNEADPAAGFGTAAILAPEPQTNPRTPFVPGTCSVGAPETFPPLAYLTLPTSCAPTPTALTADSWQDPTPVSTAPQAQLKGCDPRFQSTQGVARPLTERASSPSGLDFNLDVNQENLTKNVTEAGRLIPGAGVIAASQVKKAVVTLPEGMSVNPSVAAGLGVCTPAQYEAETLTSAPGAACPNASKIGEMTVQSPLSETPIEGGLFLAEPYRNPFGSLLALYMVAKDPDRDLIVKLAGEVDADPASGRLVASFDKLPELPYSHLNVHFRESQRAPLATPPACGSYETQTDLTPWLDPTQVFHRPASFALTQGIGGGSCPAAQAPFNPQAGGGTYNRNAGSYTPFYLHLTRSDGDQEITSYSAQLPPGLLGKIAGVPFCPESDIAAAARNDGFAETEHPSCPAAAKIGHTTAGYGLGSALAYAPGNLYLAGPYHGSPLSVVAIDSATVGPFDLGVIIVRSAIRVDPRTAQVSIDSAGSDPIPHIVKGIPLHLRDIRVYIDRPDFMVNPTSCEHFGVTSTLNGSGAVFSNPADDSTASLTNPFQVSFCSSLEFAPRIDLRLKGGTRRGKFPSLKATVTPRPGQANIGQATVNLPPSLFLEQSHIDTICSQGQSAAGKCPAGSIYGKARAITPLMDEPLEGPVYLRASANKLPDLVAALTGRGVRVDVVGRIDSKHGGMRATYDVLPDAPLTKFALTLNGGKHGLLVNSDNICKSPPATARMAGQNNSGVVLRPNVINPACKKAKARKKGHTKQSRGHRR